MFRHSIVLYLLFSMVTNDNNTVPFSFCVHPVSEIPHQLPPSPVLAQSTITSFCPNCYSYPKRIATYIKSHPCLAASQCASALGLVSAIRIRALRLKLQNPQLWSLWKYDSTTMSHEPLSDDELLYEIQGRYFNPLQPVDFVEPLRLFFNDIIAEESLLKNYHSYAQFFIRLRLSMFIDRGLAQSIPQRLERLNYVRVLCLEWISKSKVPAARA